MMAAHDCKPRRCIRVVAALFEKGGKVLITQRRPQAFMPLKWEFPGGKVEPGENDSEAIKREIKEELGVDISVGEEFMSLVHQYPDFDVDFHVLRCEISPGQTPRSIAVQDFRWVPFEELSKFEFPPADQPTIHKLLE
jgi:8-oxo-dGTP diphosphatase